MTVANPTITKYRLVYNLSQKKSGAGSFDIGAKLRKIDDSTRGRKFKVFLKLTSFFTLLLAPVILYRK